MRPTSKTVRVIIPPGVQDGSRLRLRGEGDAGSHGARPGDLYVFLSVAAPKQSSYGHGRVSFHGGFGGRRSSDDGGLGQGRRSSGFFGVDFGKQEVWKDEPTIERAPGRSARARGQPTESFRAREKATRKTSPKQVPFSDPSAMRNSLESEEDGGVVEQGMPDIGSTVSDLHKWL